MDKPPLGNKILAIAASAANGAVSVGLIDCIIARIVVAPHNSSFSGVGSEKEKKAE